MKKKLIILYLTLLSFKVYGYPEEGWGGENNFTSTTHINPTIASSITIGFIIFVLYMSFRVWLGLKKDKRDQKVSEEDE